MDGAGAGGAGPPSHSGPSRKGGPTARNGKVLGEIKQANRVEAGSLDKGWGEAAEFAAKGAAHGIFELVEKARKSL